MSYLFESLIEPSLTPDVKDKDRSRYGHADRLRGFSRQMTDTLLRTHPKTTHKQDDDRVSDDLVAQMTTKTSKGKPHASDYVSEWRMVSDNAGIIGGMVRSELHQAVQIGVDTRDPEVIGRMIDIAVQVWSALGQYTGPPQSDLRR